MESKITKFGLEFMEKSRFEIEKEIRSRKVINTEIKTKLNLIYASKCKSNAKGRWIKMKTLNLTQSRARNDPINRQIQCFSFRDFKNEAWRSRYDFFQFSWPILDFKHSLDMKMSLEDEEFKRFLDCGV